MPIEASYMDLLKKVLEERFVPFLPPLLDQTRPPDEQHKKNVSRAFSAFVLHHLCEVSEEMAAKSVVDDFNDDGIDAIEIAYSMLRNNKAKGLSPFLETKHMPYLLCRK